MLQVWWIQSSWWDDFQKGMDHFNPMVGMPIPQEENPENKSIATMNFIKSFFYKAIDEFNKKVLELQRVWLTEESDCIKELIKVLWTQTEKVNEVIRNKYPDIKEAQDNGRWKEDSDQKWWVVDAKENSKKECPDCWEQMDWDTCPECWYTFKS